MKKFLLLLTLVLSLLSLGLIVSVAQEGTQEAPVVLPAENDTDTVFGINATTVFAIFAFVMVIANGIINHNAIGGYKEALARKDVRDLTEQKYLQSSVSIQDAIKLMRSAIIVGAGLNVPGLDEYLEGAKDFLEDVTDGQPNK